MESKSPKNLRTLAEEVFDENALSRFPRKFLEGLNRHVEGLHTSFMIVLMVAILGFIYCFYADYDLGFKIDEIRSQTRTLQKEQHSLLQMTHKLIESEKKEKMNSNLEFIKSSKAWNKFLKNYDQFVSPDASEDTIEQTNEKDFELIASENEIANRVWKKEWSSLGDVLEGNTTSPSLSDILTALMTDARRNGNRSFDLDHVSVRMNFLDVGLRSSFDLNNRRHWTLCLTEILELIAPLSSTILVSYFVNLISLVFELMVLIFVDAPWILIAALGFSWIIFLVKRSESSPTTTTPIDLPSQIPDEASPSSTPTEE